MLIYIYWPLQLCSYSTNRLKTIDQVKLGHLKHCSISQLNDVPFKILPTGSFTTCCNRTSLTPAVSWFMQMHGDLSVFVHPVTDEANLLLDHTRRLMWLGHPVPLDLAGLPHDAPACPDNSKSVTYKQVY